MPTCRGPAGRGGQALRRRSLRFAYALCSPRRRRLCLCATDRRGGVRRVISEATAQARLERAEAKVQILEAMIEDKTRDLFLANRQLSAAASALRAVHEAMPAALFVTDESLRVVETNEFAASLLGFSRESLLAGSLTRWWPEADIALGDSRSVHSLECEWEGTGNIAIPVLVSARLAGDEPRRWICVAVDQRERRRLEAELRQAQKLEAVGQLAAGVAHEINTPLQFVGDNVQFLGSVVDSLLTLVDAHREVVEDRGAAIPAAARGALTTLMEEADLDYIRRRGPRAVDRARQGVARVAEIVAALRRFSHPGQAPVCAELNELVETTLVIAKNEYKYVADITLNLGDLPTLMLHEGEVQQALLNLIVNAAHAVTERHGDHGTGTIRIGTTRDSTAVTIRVSDNGCGIPPELQERVFEPFFTTKPVGEGTGQGLAQVHAMARRHDAQIKLESEPGQGTSVIISFPLTAQEQAA
ncbi:MAG: PAS domain-containing protein [Myxococcales bacterium FL481]|nr:MAG: PAS domain-containing protein [Myxococcales bacterium FL481]